jgi:hypothetical protein
MKKSKLIFVLVSLILSSCSVVVKKIAGLKNPVVETKESTIRFLNKIDYPTTNTYILGGSNDSSQIINNILKCLSQDVLLYNNIGVRYCYKSKEKCNGVKLKNAVSDVLQYYEPCKSDTITMQEVISTFEPLDLDNTTRSEPDYFLIIYWSKFYGGKKRMTEVLDLLSLKNTSIYNISIILVNTDLQADWGLEKGKRLKLKFKFLGQKSASLEFGRIPYQRQNNKCP